MPNETTETIFVRELKQPAPGKKQWAAITDADELIGVKMGNEAIMRAGRAHTVTIEHGVWNGKATKRIVGVADGVAPGAPGGFTPPTTPQPASQPAQSSAYDDRQVTIEMQSMAKAVIEILPGLIKANKFDEATVREHIKNAALWGYRGLQDAKAELNKPAAAPEPAQPAQEAPQDPDDLDDGIPFWE